MLASSFLDGMFHGVSPLCKAGYHQKRGEPMPKRILPLSDLQVKNAKPREKDFKLSDGHFF